VPSMSPRRAEVAIFDDSERDMSYWWKSRGK
jgi:hypothetical protein